MNFSQKTDAQLARFCVSQCGVLARIEAEIKLAQAPDGTLQASFDETAAALTAATEELQRRLDNDEGKQDD